MHAYHVVRALSRAFDLTVAGFEEADESFPLGVRTLESWGVRVRIAPFAMGGRLARLGSSLLSGQPLQVRYYADPSMEKLLEGIAGAEPPFDALVCHFIRMAPFAKHVRARVKVIDLADSVALSLRRRLRHAPLFERPSIWLESERVHRFEETVMMGFDEGWVVSDVDRKQFPGAPPTLRVLRPGVDESLYEGDVPADTSPVIGFLGYLSVPHNVDAAVELVREILPRVRQRGLDARVRLIGGSPSRTVRRLAREPHVEWTGFVPHLAQALQDLRVFCSPIRFSAGVQSKLIDALAAGTSIVTSPQAAEALGAGASEWMRLAQSPDEYAAAIAGLWQRSPEEIQRLRRGRQWAREQFRWSGYAERLEELLGDGVTA